MPSQEAEMATLPADLNPQAIRALAIDLDRTLLPASHRLSALAITSIERLRRLGVLSIIATGRTLSSALPYARQVATGPPLICYQGALVADQENATWLLHRPIATDLARGILEMIEILHLDAIAYVDDGVFVRSHNAAVERYRVHSGLPVNPVGKLSRWLSTPTTKIAIVGEPALLTESTPQLRVAWPDVSVSRSLPSILEITEEGVSKGTALRYVCAELEVSPADVVAIGDGDNDVELFETAGYGVAVADASAALLSRAGWIVPSAEEDGVGLFLAALVASWA